ncbi:hypothetical protein J3459_004059 [Metarhizium acridum]|nr:hypothetical protein J3459_004059 [Metarhizium acridum]
MKLPKPGLGMDWLVLGAKTAHARARRPGDTRHLGDSWPRPSWLGAPSTGYKHDRSAALNLALETFRAAAPHLVVDGPATVACPLFFFFLVPFGFEAAAQIKPRHLHFFVTVAHSSRAPAGLQRGSSVVAPAQKFISSSLLPLPSGAELSNLDLLAAHPLSELLPHTPPLCVHNFLSSSFPLLPHTVASLFCCCSFARNHRSNFSLFFFLFLIHRSLAGLLWFSGSVFSSQPLLRIAGFTLGFAPLFGKPLVGSWPQS